MTGLNSRKGGMNGQSRIASDGDGARSSLPEILAFRAETQGDDIAFQFLCDSPGGLAKADVHEITYRDLHRRAISFGASIALALREEQPSPRVVLLCPPGLEFVSAFYACLYIGAIAVPIQPPGRRQDAKRWSRILKDAAPQVMLTSRALHQAAAGMLAEAAMLERVRLLTVEELSAEPMSEGRPSLALDSQRAEIALLQYTSGSTNWPRGVVITHAQLIANLEQIRQRFELNSESRGVSWLPPYHDMGLIGGILLPVYTGFSVTLMAPVSFLRRPLRWLQAVAHCGATISGGPNFAYEYCLRRYNGDDAQNLDLSSWRLALNGAETVRESTLRRFAERFAAHGFDAAAFLPCYGLAEATLLAAAERPGGRHRITLKREALSYGSVELCADTPEPKLELVGCGTVVDATEMRIVDTQTGRLLPDREIGEICLAGPAVASGYWNNAEETRKAFSALPGHTQDRFLHTGDLGFVSEQQLFVTGRIRELIVIRGANYAPQDIELSCETADAGFLPAATAAFAAHTEQGEELVVLQEVERGHWSDDRLRAGFAAICAAISNDHGLQVGRIALLKPFALPKTPSGKIQRLRSRTLYLNGELPELARWPEKRSAHTSMEPTPDNASHTQVDALLDWMREFAESTINSRLMDQRRTLSPAVLLAFGNRGLLGMQAPLRYGGLQLQHRECHRVIEQLAAIDPTLALFVGLNNVLGLAPIMHSASPSVSEQWLPLLASGRELAAFALTERNAGSHPQAMKTSARAAGEGAWRINGEKIWSGSAAWAGIINVFVRQYDDSGRPTGFSAFAVPRGRPGMRQGPEALTMGMRAMVQNSVLFDDVPVDTTDLLGEANVGMQVAQSAMMQGRLVIAAACVGGMKRCAQLMRRYASRRTVATGILLEQPLILSRLHAITAAVEALQCLVNTIGGRLDHGHEVTEEVYAACKVLGPDLYWQATDALVQCLGGRGYIESNAVPQMLRDVRVLRIFEGPTETLAAFLASSFVHKPERLQRFLTSLGADMRIEQELQATARLLAAQTDRWQTGHVVLGESVAWMILLAVVSSDEQVDAGVREWVDQRYRDICLACERLTADSRRHSLATLVHTIDSYTADIGDLEAAAAGEDHDADDWLRRERMVSVDTEPAPANAITATLPGQTAIKDWLSRWIAAKLKIPETEVSAERAFADFGIDSVLAVEMAHDLEQAFALDSVDPAMAWNYPTIGALAAHLYRSNELAETMDSTAAAEVDELAATLQAEIALGRR